MKELLQSVAAKAAGGWQHAGAKLDFEVLALPGGSLIAVALWLYSLVTVTLKWNRPRSLAKRLTLDGCIDTRAKSARLFDRKSEAHPDTQLLDARPATSLSSLRCARQRAHCA